MRKFLLATAATLGTGGMIGTAVAQAPVVGAPTQGQMAFPAARPAALANNNNNYQAPAIPGVLANPTPGTIVVHVNGRVQVEFQGVWSSVDQRVATTPAAGSLAAVLGTNGAGTVKLAPYAINSYARIYLGGDAMATNGLRYGAAIELRQNFTGQISSNASSGASGYSSLNTTYVRRAFTYIAGETWGIVRLGQADGIIGIFDNGVTTFQMTPTGNLNGGSLEGNPPRNAVVPFFFLGQAGNEYDNAKIVYLSPQIAGFDFGFQYAPNTSNGNGLGGSNNPLNGSITGSGIGTGLGCAVANSGCPTLSSGPGIQDGARATNQTAVGVRYQGKFGDLGLLAYGVYEFSGTVNYTGSTAAAVLGNTGTLSSSRFNGKFDGLSFGSAGLALTYAGFTVGGNFIGGRLNGQLATAPQGGVGEFAYLLGAKYVTGPFTIGVVGEIGWYQGNVNLTGISQRRGRAIDVAASYAVAPGYDVFAEYMYQDLKQSGFNFLTSAAGSGANNRIQSQGVLIGNVVRF